MQGAAAARGAAVRPLVQLTDSSLEAIAADDQPAPLAPAGTGAAAAATAHVAAGAAAAASGAAAGAAAGASGSGGGGSAPGGAPKRERDEDAAAQPARAAPGGARRSGRAAPQRADTHGAAGPSTAPAPASPKAYFTIRRTGELKYLSCAALEAALQAGDRVLLQGVMQGPLRIRFEGVRLRGDLSGDIQPELVAFEHMEGATAAVFTLTVSADDVRVGYICVRTPRATQLRPQAGAVLVKQNVADFVMFSCSILGHGTRWVVKTLAKVNFGHSGIVLEQGVRNAVFRIMTFAELSGDGFAASAGCTVRLSNVRMKNVAGLGVHLRCTGKCLLEEVHVKTCGTKGVRINAFDVCTLRECSAHLCIEGFVFVMFDATDEPDGAGRPDVAVLMHDARGLISSKNGTFGVVTEGGVAVDLSGAIIDDNGCSGVRAELPAPPAGATARTLLAGAVLRRNGLDPEADKSQAEHAAIAVEHSMLPWIDTTGVIMEGNGVDACVEVAAAAAGAD